MAIRAQKLPLFSNRWYLCKANDKSRCYNGRYRADNNMAEQLMRDLA